MSSAAIDVKGLSKKYGSNNNFALKDLTLHVKPGEVYGFLGPNGAGKTTTIRLLLNFIQPTEGSATILGQDIVKDSVAIKRSVGYLSGEVALYPKMTGAAFINYMSALAKPKNPGYADELARRFEVNLKPKIRELSKGNRQKLGIIQAFAHQPDILILDEPTSGLDPLKQEEFFGLISETKKRGGSIFFSSHNLAEVQHVCDRVGFIREGKLIAEQTIADIAAAAARTFDLVFSEKAPLADLRAIPGAKVASTGDKSASVHIRGELASLFRVLAKHRVMSINQRELSLEGEFLRFYGGRK